MTRAIHTVVGSKKRLTLFGALVIALAAGLVAFAYWTSSGTGAGAASVGTLNAPSITSATPGAGTVALTWSAVTPPSTPAVTYYVTRDGGTPAGDRPLSGSPTSVLACTDSGLSAGSHSYTVTAKWKTWTATSASQLVTVTSGALDHFTLSAATTTPIAGQANSLTITAKDSANNTVTGYTGAHNLTFSGASTIGAFSPTVTDKDGNVVNFGNTTLITFTAGVATVSGANNGVMKLYKVEAATIVVTDGSVSNTGLGVTVSAAAAAGIALTGSIADLTSGGAARTFTATVQDSFGNTVTTGADSTVSVSFAQTAGAGSVSGTGSSPASGGVATKSLTGVTAGSVTVGASATLTVGATNSNTLTFNVVAGAATQLVFTTPARTVTAGGAVSSTITVERRDVNNNPTTLGGDLVVNLSGTSATDTFRNSIDTATITTVTIPAGSSSADFTYKDSTAGSYTITGASGALTSATQGVTVSAATGTLTARATANWNVASTWSALKTGTITTTTPSATVTGVGTAFLTEVRVGDTIFQNNLTTVIGVVQSVNSNTSITLVANAAVAVTGATYAVGRVPLATDNVSIVGAFNVTIPSSYSAVANTVSYGSASTTLQTIVFTDATSTLTVGGDLTIFAPSGSATRNLPLNAGTLNVGGNLNLGQGAAGNQANRVSEVTITTGTATVRGNLVFNAQNFTSPNAANNQLLMSGGAGTFNLAGSFTINGGAGTPSGTLAAGTTSSFSFFGGGAQSIPVGVGSVIYNDVTVSNTSTSGATFSAGASAGDITGDVTIAAGSVLNAGNFTHSLAGNLTDSGTFNANSSTIVFEGTAAQAINGSSTTTFNNLAVNSSSTVTPAASIGVAGDLTVSAGTFDLGSNTADRTSSGGTLTVSGGTLKIGGTNTVPANYSAHSFSGGTIEYSGSNQTVSAENYFGLTFSGSGTKTAAGNVGVAGDFNNNGTTFAAGTNTVTINGAGAQAIGGSSSTSFYDLTVTKSAGTATLGANESVGNNLSVTQGTLDLNTFTLNGGGAGTFSLGNATSLLVGGASNFPTSYGTTSLGATSTVNYDGAAQTVSTQTYGNLTVSGTAAKTLPATPFTIAGTFSTSGTATATASAAIAVGVDMSIGAGSTFSAGSFSHSITGSFTNAGTYTGGSATVSVGGNFTSNTNTFTGGTGTFTLNGAGAQSIGGTQSVTFNNLTVNKASGTATLGRAENVAGNASIQSGTLDLATFTLNRTVAGGSFTMSAGTTLLIGGTNPFPTNYSTKTFAATSTVNYDGTSQSVSGEAYGNLTIGLSGTATLGGTGTVAGDLTVSSGTFTLGANTINRASGGGTLSLAGGTTLNIGGTNGFPSNYATRTLAATSTVVYNGTSQPVSGETYGNLTSSASGTATLQASGSVVGNLSVTTGTLDLQGFTLDRASTGGIISASAGATLKIGGTGTFPANYATHTLNATSTVNYAGSNQNVTGETYGNLTVSISGTATLAATGTVATVLTVSSGTFDIGSFTINRATNGNGIVVSAGATLKIGANSFPTGYTTVTLDPASTVEYYGGGAQTITAVNYGNLTSSGAGARTLANAGTIGVSGTFAQGSNTYTITGSTVNFNGANGQTIPAFNYNNLSSSNNNRTLESGTIGIAATFTPGSGTYTVTGSTVNFNGAAQAVASFTYNNLTVSGSGNKTAASPVTVGGDLLINAGTYVAGAATNVAGNFTNNSTFTAGGGNTVTLNGSSAQVVGGSASTTFTNLTINNAAGVSLNGVDANVAGTLALGTSILSTGANKVNVTTTTAPTRTTGFVNGALQRTVGNATQTFAVGNGSNDTTVTIVVSGVAGGPSILVRSVAGEHPNVGTSGLSSTKDVNTYWTLTATPTLTLGNTTFNYPAANVDAGGAAPFQVKRWNGTAWSAVTVGTSTGTATTVSGLTSANLGDFIIGNP